MELQRLPSVGTNVWPGIGFSPDGKVLIGTYADHRARLWDLSTASVVFEFSDGLVFNPNSDIFAVLAANSVSFYDSARYQKVKSFATDGLANGLGAFSPDGHLLAYRAEYTNVVVMDTESGKTLQTLVHPMPVLGLSWHPLGRYLAASGSDVHIWEARTGQRVRMLEGHRGGQAVTLSFSHDGKLLASGGWDGRIILWDPDSARQLVDAPESGIVSFGPDDRTLVSVGWDQQELDFFEVAPGREARAIYERTRVLQVPNGYAYFSANGHWLAYDTLEGAALFDMQTRQEVASVKGAIWLWGFDAEDKNVVGGIALSDEEWRPFRWPVEAYTAHKNAAVSSSANPTEPLAEGTSVPGNVVDPSLQLGDRLLGTGGWLSSDRRLCAVVGGDRCQILHTDDFTEQARTGVQSSMRYAALSADGRLVATGPFHGRGVKVWDAHTGALVKDFPLEEAGARVAFSPNGRWLVGGTGSRYQFWEVGTWRTGLRIVEQEGAGFWAPMAFSPDGSMLAGTLGFAKVRLFNAATGEVLADLELPNPQQITCISFSPDGSQLAVVEGHVSLHLWDLRAIREQLASMRLNWDLPPYPTKGDASPR
jgi:WD40 repeat protein